MRYTLLAVLLAATACEPLHGSAFRMHYDVVPRKLVLSAMDAARELHYDVVAIESPDVRHNTLLAFADGSRRSNTTALLIQIAWPTGACRSDLSLDGCGSFDMPTDVAVTPLAFRNGVELPKAQVPAETKAHAEQLMYAIYDRNRGNRHLNTDL